MKIDFFCPRWGSENVAWQTFLNEVKTAGYLGIEWFPFGEKTDYWEVLQLMSELNLKFSIVMTVIDEPQEFKAYLTAFENQLLSLSAIRTDKIAPLFITAQTGREFFSVEQVEDCIEVCRKVTAKTGIMIYQETHRNKWAYAAYKVVPILEKYEDVLLTLDISHWFCVSESYLHDQQHAVNLAVLHARHVHARVGHTQGPQVWDPALPQYKQAFDEHLKIWDKWVQQRIIYGDSNCTITPEFGPPPYLVYGNREGNPRDEQWRLNLWMKNFLEQRYSD